MKKIILSAMLIITLGFIACNEETKNTEEIPSTSANAVMDKLEALSADDSDTTKLVCSCEHKCTTEAECVEKCGEGCGKLEKK